MTTLEFSSMIEGKPRKISIDGAPVCVVRVKDEVFAIGDTCSHSEASLSEGDVSGYKIECWLHGAEFDLRTGEALTPPASMSVPLYEVAVEGDLVVIKSQTEEKK
ncbi:MAG: non-heme iron oxygenase ferredoxin subunit [Actinomycetes bacterium]